jgi:hypothetical protein
MERSEVELLSGHHSPERTIQEVHSQAIRTESMREIIPVNFIHPNEILPQWMSNDGMKGLPFAGSLPVLTGRGSNYFNDS